MIINDNTLIEILVKYMFGNQSLNGTNISY